MLGIAWIHGDERLVLRRRPAVGVHADVCPGQIHGGTVDRLSFPIAGRMSIGSWHQQVAIDTRHGHGARMPGDRYGCGHEAEERGNAG
jgi:hypothetical protein